MSDLNAKEFRNRTTTSLLLLPLCASLHFVKTGGKVGQMCEVEMVGHGRMAAGCRGRHAANCGKGWQAGGAAEQNRTAVQ